MGEGWDTVSEGIVNNNEFFFYNLFIMIYIIKSDIDSVEDKNMLITY